MKEPIRVYAGLRSAPDARTPRPHLAVEELERTGAFDREVLAVVTVTGTGWVDPDAAQSLEYEHNGNTAIVGSAVLLPPELDLVPRRRSTRRPRRARR